MICRRCVRHYFTKSKPQLFGLPEIDGIVCAKIGFKTEASVLFRFKAEFAALPRLLCALESD